jgi:Na+:H+ antiporter, NhaA family
MKLTKLFTGFFESEKSGGLILILATILSLWFANSDWNELYLGIWNYNIVSHTTTEWINDGLMAIFFLLIGLELEREIYKGELANFKNAALPLIGALGGMLVPAGIYLFFNFGTATQSGAGIPMATDIAFAVGILSLLGDRVPAALKIFLTALAVIDDLGAIIVIALFYTKTISFLNLAIAMAIWILLLGLNRKKIHNLFPYLIGGVVMWYFMQQSGIHATITGVLLAFAIPFGKGGKQSPSYLLQDALHLPVAYIILPLFALANTCIPIESGWYKHLADDYSVGIIAGLALGKPIGIGLFAFLGVILGICALPQGLKWKHIIGVGFLGGIGFTMSIFIALLGFDDAEIIEHSKMAILIASLISASVGFFVLKSTLKN